MKLIELEKLLLKHVNEIEKSRLIPKCRQIAEELGEYSTSHQSESKDYNFSDNSIKVNYTTHKMGSQYLEVTSGRTVFRAVGQILNNPPRLLHPIINVDDRRSKQSHGFEIQIYRPGEWIHKVEDLYIKSRMKSAPLNTNVSKEVLKDIQQRFGLPLSKGKT